MELHNMKPTPGSRSKRKRVGRGDKTAGRGENGQKSRAGYSKKIGFEGGQNPLYRRIPKRGFKNINTVRYAEINVSQLETLGEANVDVKVLKSKRLIRRNATLLKIMGDGELTKAIKIEAHKFTKSAVEKIEKVGGKIIIIEPRINNAVKKK